MVTPDRIRDDLRRFIVDTFLFGDLSSAPADDESFLERQVLDSTGVLQLIAHLESTYQMSIADEELIPANLDSLNRLTAFVQRKMGA